MSAVAAPECEAIDIVFPPPPPPRPPYSVKFRNEQAAFRRLLPELLKTHRGLYVAIHDGEVVDSGTEMLEVADRVFDRIGYVPILVTLVTEEPKPIGRIPSPRNLSRTTL